MTQKTAQPSAAPPPPRGVAGPPFGLSSGALWGVIAGLVTVFGLLFWLAADAFEASTARWSAPLEAPAPAPSPPPPAVAPPEERIEEPREPTWTLVDIEGAVTALGPQIGDLIEAGRSELPEFRALSSGDATRAARARERYAAWARIWRNRVGQLSEQLPPARACAVHAAMDPACYQLRDILTELVDVAAADELDVARARLDGAATSLDLFLNPPEPEPEEEEVGAITDE